MTKSKKLGSIRTKTTLIIGLLFVSLIITISLILNFVMLDKISLLEEQWVEEQVSRAQKAITAEVDDLSETTVDWGQWDDSCKFVQDVNQKYVENNLTYESLVNIRADFIVFLNAEGEHVYSSEVDKENSKVSALSSNVKTYLEVSPLISSTGNMYHGKGLLLLEKGIALVASCPIRSSEATGPVQGRLILGRFLDSDELKRIADRADLDLAIERMDSLSYVNAQIFHSMTAGASIFVKDLDENNVGGYYVIRDVNQQATIGLSIKTDRSVGQIGQTGVRYTLFALIVASFIFTLLILLFLDRNILSRLLGLSHEIRLIGERGIDSVNLKTDNRNDEIAIVTEEINNMLFKLEDSKMQIIESKEQLKRVNDNLEKEVMDRTMELYQSNKSLQDEIAQRTKTQERVQHIAYHDSLTGLPNRLSFIDQLNRSLSETNPEHGEVAVLFLDLDSFKLVNDTWGHSAGDQLLKKVAKRLINTMRKSDVIARIGGDEFIVLIEKTKTEDSYKFNIIAEKILKSFKAPFIINNQEYFVTASIGVAVYPSDGLNADALIKNADIAMYKAKERGKNQCVFCDKSMENIVIGTMKLTNNLYRALEHKEFELYYQPQVNYATKEIVGLEALIRWNHPEMGRISPGEFIPVAEQTGLIIPIGEWAIRTACMQNRTWQELGLPNIRVAVNLSVMQFQCENIVQQVEQALKETGLDGRYLELEITESVVINDIGYVVNVLKQFKKLGINISIDDFGTEFSSMQYLKQLPVDRIKIPMPFTHGIGVNDKDEAIIKAFIVLAKNMGLGIISEGVETEEQLDFLVRRKCDEIQGYYYYRPMPAKEIEILLRKALERQEGNKAGAKANVEDIMI